MRTKTFKSIVLILMLSISGLITGCKQFRVVVSEDKTPTDIPNPSAGSFESYISQTPISVQTGHTFYSDVPYGAHSSNRLDLWVSKAASSGPLVIFIHGGGFTGGDKESAWTRRSEYGIGQEQIETFLKEGISFATINYRLLKKNDKEGVLKSLNDSKRAIQFLRHYDQELGFDGDKIGLAGSSAGAGTAIWLAFNNDMADQNSDDPILRESTRVKAVAAQETQSTYDILKWSDEVFPEGLFSIDKIKNTGLENRLKVFYGVDDFDQLETDQLLSYRRQVDMLSIISSDDPPIYILNKKDFTPDKGNLLGNLLHSPYHAVALKKEIERAGIESEIYIPAEGSKPSASQTMANFLIVQLKR